jgi:hypothetical protein
MSSLDLIAILALVGYAIYRQTRVAEVTGRARFKLAIIYGIVGLCLGVHLTHDRASLALLAISLLASFGVGLLRGRHTRMWQAADGRIFTKGTTVTVGLFLALVAFKFGLGTLAYLTHIPYESGIGEVLVMVAIMLAVQAELVWRRAQALGAPRPAVEVGASACGASSVPSTYDSADALHTFPRHRP